MVIRQLTVNIPSLPVAEDVTIQAGAPVGLNAEGKVAVYDGDTVTRVYGISADAKIGSNEQTTYTGFQTYAGASATSIWTQNRIPDGYDNTWASGRISVYAGSSTLLYTDQFVADDFGSEVAPGSLIYANSDGKLTTDSSGNSDAIAILMAGPATVPSGIPGTDAGHDDRTTDLAFKSEQEDNTYILISLV